MTALRNVTPRARPADDPIAIEIAYRRAFWTIVGHGVFLVVCCVIAIVLRRLFKLPPALLTVAFFVALLLFGGDLWRFVRYRRKLRLLQEQNLE